MSKRKQKKENTRIIPEHDGQCAAIDDRGNVFTFPCKVAAQLVIELDDEDISQALKQRDLPGVGE